MVETLYSMVNFIDHMSGSSRTLQKQLFAAYIENADLIPVTNVTSVTSDDKKIGELAIKLASIRGKAADASHVAMNYAYITATLGIGYFSTLEAVDLALGMSKSPATKILLSAAVLAAPFMYGVRDIVRSTVNDFLTQKLVKSLK